MGLDMYLSRKKYIGANYEYRNVQGKIELTEGQDNTPININLKKIKYIEEEAGYWRKANAIHNWFVENVQGGVDECQQSYVDISKLEELLKLCKEVKTNPEKGNEILPTQGGFFFGTTEYDEWYMQSIEETIEILEKALENSEDYEYYYQASW